MLYSGKSKANGLLFKWKSLLQNEFWNTQSFAMYRPSSNESPNKTSYLFASVSLLNINISGVARIRSDSTWLPPETLYSACRVQETLFLKDFNSKSNLFSVLTSVLFRNSPFKWFQIHHLMQTETQAKISMSVGTVETVQTFDWDKENETPS